MKKLALRHAAVLVMSICIALGGGCGDRSAVRLYLLNSMAGPAGMAEAVSGGHADIIIGIGPINIPDYLKRSEIVTRDGRNRLLLSDSDLWAETLEENISRVLAENLSILLSSERIMVSPWRKISAMRYQVKLELMRFDSASEGEAFLEARWMILSTEAQDVISVRKSFLREPVASKTYEAVVAAQSRLIEKLSREIAAALRSLPPKTTYRSRGAPGPEAGR